MDDPLLLLGLSAKEARVYQLLLGSARLSAAQIADKLGEKRTNVYALVDNLAAKGLIQGNDQGVAQYSAADPERLHALLELKHAEYAQTVAGLKTVLPHLKSQYALTHNRPGVVHMAGQAGFLQLLDTMVESKTEVLLVASNDVPDQTATLTAIRKCLVQRRDNGIATRALFHHSKNDDMTRRIFMERGMDLRFVGNTPFAGEVVLFEDNVAFTVYKPSIIVTVVTNPSIALTMRSLFEAAWQQADC